MAKNIRKQGILLPISSLPSKYGIGTLGREAYRFVDFLEASGNRLWQILPLGPTGYGDSPYQSFSTFAGNPYFIDPERLIEEGLLSKEYCDSFDFGDDPHSVDYERIYLSRFQMLRAAFESEAGKALVAGEAYATFAAKNAYWLDDYALYMAVKNDFGGVCFLEWDEDIRLRKASAMKKYRKKLSDEVEFYRFQQFLFTTQWQELKRYANKHGVEIVGDIPIYVAFDSADSWANPKLFQLDDEGRPVAVAGCPPDCFSETGQLWGNPLYDWKVHKKSGYTWWMQRIAHCYELYDVLRIDHFRGFDAYWSVPYGDDTAVNGHWEDGPGYELFAVMKKELGRKKVIAEDLGFLTPRVRKMVKKTGYPGMKILLFAFDAYQNSEYLPYNYDHNCVVYTGTHDNQTTVGFLQSMPKKDVQFAKKYLNCKKEEKLYWEIIRLALSSCADTAIIPMQDYLGLDDSARINTPSTLGENWKWRMDEDALSHDLAKKIKKLAKLYHRL